MEKSTRIDISVSASYQSSALHARYFRADPLWFAVIIQSEDLKISEMIKSQIPIIDALVKGTRAVQLVSSASEVPAGCGSEQISAAVVVHIPVKVSRHSERSGPKIIR